METSSSGLAVPLMMFAGIVALAAVMVAVKFIARAGGRSPAATADDAPPVRKLIVVALAIAIAIAMAILVLIVQPGGGS